ncbi:MAG: hypothetical protein LHW57_03055 [Candidatus Cloacimonetes bacterium]|nr:hypothetical protein [Candidatus Cloacimonadota bacterium]
MNFRKLILIALAAFFAWQAAALTIGELQELFYQTEDEAAFAREAEIFIGENDDLDEVEHAFWMCYNVSPDSCAAWLEARILEPQANPKYLYLRLQMQDDPLTKLDQALALIGSNPGFAGAYRALLLTYVQDFDPDEISDPESAIHLQLQGDLPLLAHYAASFPDDGYARMAQVYQLMLSGDPEAARLAFREAVENGDAWIDDIGLRQMFTPAQYHPLLACQIEALRANDGDAYSKYRIAELAGDLADYHYDLAKDYDAVIGYFGADPWYWENQYVIYALTMSYLAKEQAEKAVDLLNGNNDHPTALQFQDAWLAFDPEQAADAYTRILEPVAEVPLNAYLLARAQTDNLDKLARARALVTSHPRVEHGYSLAAEVYLRYFSDSPRDDPNRDRMSSSLQDDAQLLRNYYFRFPDNHLATAGYFLVNLDANDDDKALRAYKKLTESGLGETLGSTFAKIALDKGRMDLLRRIKAYEVRLDEENSELGEDEIGELANQAYCLSLYENGLYAEVVEEVGRNPGWMDDPEIQFMLVNAHYFQDDFAQTIAALRLMVEKGTIGTSMLKGLNDPELTGHPDWLPLLDLAATLPDPDAAPEPDTGSVEEDRE